MKKIKSVWALLWAKHYAVLTGDTQDEINWAIESLRTADHASKHPMIVIKGEAYELASYGEELTDGSRKATVRRIK